MAKRLRIGIIGCGTIGGALGRYCAGELSEKIEVKALFDTERRKARELRDNGAPGADIADSVDDIVSSCDLIVESASVNVSAEVLEKAINRGKDSMIMSVGGLLGREDLLELAGKNGIKVYMPSGAVIGLDGLKAARVGNIREVTLTTRKPPASLKEAPYVRKKDINLDKVKDDFLIFEGTAASAVKAFPKNVNVSATLSLAGIGADKTMVRVMCSPRCGSNTHQVDVRGDFGTFSVKTENLPSPDNPKTSYLTALSAIATLKDIVGGIRIGT
jgi:aspartate dehydrogenase